VTSQRCVVVDKFHLHVVVVVQWALSSVSLCWTLANSWDVRTYCIVLHDGALQCQTYDHWREPLHNCRSPIALNRLSELCHCVLTPSLRCCSLIKSCRPDNLTRYDIRAVERGGKKPRFLGVFYKKNFKKLKVHILGF